MSNFNIVSSLFEVYTMKLTFEDVRINVFRLPFSFALFAPSFSNFASCVRGCVYLSLLLLEAVNWSICALATLSFSLSAVKSNFKTNIFSCSLARRREPACVGEKGRGAINFLPAIATKLLYPCSLFLSRNTRPAARPLFVCVSRRCRCAVITAQWVL